MRSWFGLTAVVVVLLAAVVGTVLVTGGDDAPAPGKHAAATAAATAANTEDRPALPPIKGLQVTVDGLIYNVTGVRVLNFDSPSAKPYLTNLERPGKGSGYLGVFLRVYNPTGKPAVSAPGFLLEPSKQPGLAEQNSPSESPYSFEQGATVPANGVIPEPGSEAASGRFPGGLLMYPIDSETTHLQPFDLVVHTAKGTIASLRLPRVRALSDKGHG